jgi:hypothetical protein
MGKVFKTRDSALAFYVHQLENLDKRLYMPLTSVSWSRDIQLRPGITMSDESTSFIQSAFAAGGSLSNGNGTSGGNMPWVSTESTAIQGVSIDGQKLVKPLRLLAREISFTSVELERSQRLGNSIDAQKSNALNITYQMNTDQMCYIGSSDVGAQGLLNASIVTAGAVANGASGSPLWSTKTPDEILDDVNTLLTSTWQASAFAVCPGKLLLPPVQYSFLCEKKVSSAGNVSILKFLEENSIALKVNGKALDIQPVKWLGTGLGAGSTNRMVAYTNEEDRVRFPMVPIRRETAYYQGIRYLAPYIWAFGEVEFVYPETVQYADGL